MSHPPSSMMSSPVASMSRGAPKQTRSYFRADLSCRTTSALLQRAGLSTSSTALDSTCEKRKPGRGTGAPHKRGARVGGRQGRQAAVGGKANSAAVWGRRYVGLQQRQRQGCAHNTGSCEAINVSAAGQREAVLAILALVMML